MRNRKSIIGILLTLTMIINLLPMAAFASIGDYTTANGNLYVNGGFEEAEGAKLTRTQDVTPFEGNWAAVGNTASEDALKYGDVEIESGKTYISSYAVRLAPGAATYAAQDRVDFDSAASSNTANVTFYKNGELFKSKEATASNGKQTNHYAISYYTFDVTNDWTQMEAVVEFTKGAATPKHYHIKSDYSSHSATRFDAFYLGKLAVGDVSITNSDNEKITVAAKSDASQTVNLSSNILNQLGTKSGFEAESVTLSVDAAAENAGITVSGGVVTLPANVQEGTYTITGTTGNIATNNIGVVTGTHTIIVADNSAAKLTSLTISGNGISSYTFDPDTTTYTIGVPVRYTNNSVDNYTCELPTISAATADSYEVVVDEVTQVPQVVDIKVQIDGATYQKYTVNLVPIGKNLYSNGGFEEAEGAKLTRTQDVTPFEGSWAAVGNNLSEDVLKYGDVGIESGKTYISSYAVRLAPGEAAYAAQDRVDFDSAASSNTANVTFYKNGELFKSKEATASNGKQTNHYAISYYTFDVTNDWTQMEAVVEFTKGAATPKHYHIKSDYSKHSVNRFDAFFLGELSVGEVNVKNENNEKSTSISKKDTAQTVSLKGEILNQLGTKSGFENETFNWSVAPEALAKGISVDGGVVTVPANVEVGTYEVTATADINTNGIGVKSATHTIVVGYNDDAKLTALRVNGKGIGKYTFDPDTTTYTVGVPVRYSENDVDNYTYELPTITATAANGYDVVIDEITQVPQAVKIKVQKNSTTYYEYTVNLKLIGKNFYENGGFETSVTEETSKFYSGDGELLNENDVPAFEGNLVSSGFAGSAAVYYKDDIPVETGKTYLSSYAVRSANDDEYYTAQDKVEISSAYGSNTANVTFYKNGELFKSKIATVSNGKGTNHYATTGNFDVTNDWTQLQAVVEYTKGAATPLHYHIKPDYSNHPFNRFDAFYLGEMIIGGTKLFGNGTEMPSVLAVNSECQLNLSAKALTQLGDSAPLSDLTTTTIELGNEVPVGVTLSDNVLTIAKGTTGTLELNVTAAPNSNWSAAPQSCYVDTITIELTDEAFTYSENDGNATITLSYYSNLNNESNATIYYAVYDIVNGESLLSNIVGEDVTVPSNNIFYKEKTIPVISGQKVRGFLFTDNLVPLVQSRRCL